jgi:hypothetical protein
MKLMQNIFFISKVYCITDDDKNKKDAMNDVDVFPFTRAVFDTDLDH